MALVPKSPIRYFQAKSPFTKEQASWVVVEFAELKKVTLVRRPFRLKYFPRKLAAEPRENAFHRLIKRFKTTGATRPCVSPGRTPTAVEQIQEVKKFFDENPTGHVREAAELLKISVGKV